MGSARGIALTLFLLFSFPSWTHSQDCSSARLGANDVLETVQIYSNEYALDSDHVSYEIAPIVPSNSFDQVSDSIRIMVNNQSSCPSSCTVTLNRYTDSFQGAETTVLFFDTDHAFYLPSHYIKDNKTTFVCVANNGSCGATVPIYRYYKISNGGVFHAYSFEQDVVYDGYNQEFLPICYAWTVPTAIVASRPTCGTLNFNIPPEMLSDLSIYDNNLNGIERDHYYTTLPSTDPSLATYNKTGVIGKVLTSSKSTACSCLVKLQQQFDNQTGYFHRLDHKLIVTGQEPNRPYEEYVETGEVVYCSKRLGDCGATLPLWKQFQFYDVDTVYTTDSSPLPMSYLYPQTPLCYIWPSNYSPNVSTIVTGTAAPAPPVQSTTQLPGVSDSTTIGGTGSTRLSDSVAFSSPSSLGTGSTSTPTTASSTFSTASMPVSVIGSSLGTSMSTPSSSPSTVSVWGTSSVPTPSTVSTASTPITPATVSSWGTSMSTPSSSQSTISVWGTPSASTPSTLSTASTPSSPVTSSSVASLGTTGTTASVGTTGTTISGATEGTITPTPPATSGTTLTTQRLSDSGGVTPVIIPVNPVIPVNSGVTMPTTHENPVTIGEEVTEANMETEVPLNEEFNPPTPETFTLSNFWLTPTTSSIPGASSGLTTPSSIATSAGTIPMSAATATLGTTMSPGVTQVSAVTAAAVPNPTGTIPPVSSESSEAASLPITTTTVPPPIMVTGPLILIIPTMPPQTTEPPVSAASTLSTGTLPTVTQAPSANTVTLPTVIAPEGSSPTTSPTTTHSPEGTPATPTPQHMAQAAPTYSIVGGALDSFTNAPIIAAIISSSVVSSTPAPTQSQPTQPALNAIPSTATLTTTTQDPGIIWKAGDWISNAWHSMFGGSDQSVVSTSSTYSSQQITTTTPRPIGGLVGSLINSPGGNFTNSTNPISSFLNTTGNFIDQHLNGNSSQNFMNNTINWIDGKMNSTGEFLSNAWNSLQSNNVTGGSLVNNTETWIGGAINSTGGFLTNAWNSLGNSNSSSDIMNKTETWIGGAVNSTGNFLSNAWDSLSSSNTTGSIVNNTQTWIGGAINSTGGFLTNAWDSLGSSKNASSGNSTNSTNTWVGGAVDSTGEFLSNAWNSLSSSNNSIISDTKTWVGGAINSTGQFLSTAWNETKEQSGNLIEGAKDMIGGSTTSNATPLATAPHSNSVGNIASVILPIVNNATTEPPNAKIEWNGSVISGPITG